MSRKEAEEAHRILKKDTPKHASWERRRFARSKRGYKGEKPKIDVAEETIDQVEIPKKRAPAYPDIVKR